MRGALMIPNRIITKNMSNMSRSAADYCKHVRMDTKGLDGFEALRLPSPVYTDLVPDSNAYLNHNS